MFVGESNQKLDVKFRMTIPSQHRRHLEDGMVVTRSNFEQCLQLFPMEEWQRRAEKIEQLENRSRESRQLRRQFFSQAEEVIMDKQGRILINQRLREFANINSQVIVAGNNTFLEIWSQESWDIIDINEFDEGALDAVDQDIRNVF